MRAVVLSGGGSKGAYQVGVWKALKKLKIDYNIVTGTSIGSVNGMLMVQKELWKTIWLWKNISFQNLYDTSFPTKFDTLEEKKEVYKKYVENFFQNGGMNTNKMRALLNRVYNDRLFKKSNIDYGIVTVNLTKRKPMCLKKSDLKDNVVDYVLASSCCFPAFQTLDINGEKFIDGGYYDNLPINLAVELGADEVIAVDLDAVGFKKKIKIPENKITYIRPRNDIGSFLIFDKKMASRAIDYGYYDTMKIYHKLDGDKYTFKKGELEKNCQKYGEKLIKYSEELFGHSSEGVYTAILKQSLFSRILKTKKEYEIKKVINQTIEFLGKLFEIDPCYLYSTKNFNRKLVKKNNDINEMSVALIEEKIKMGKIKDLLNTKFIVKYIYNLLDKNSKHKDLYVLATLFPKEFVGAIYLNIIK